MSNALKLIAYAAWYLGRKEKPGNAGFEDASFEKEMKGVGWYLGAAWCAFFVKLCFRKLFTAAAGNDNPKLYAAVNAQFSGSCKQTWENVVKAGTFATGQEPEAGAVCICLLGHGPSGHAYIVEKVDAAKNTTTTIEGNTNASGSREGDRVARKLRTPKRAFQANGLNVLGYIYPREK